jgi:GTPase
VSANAGVVTMTQEHLNLLVALELPFFIVVTKVDVTSKQKFADTIDSLKKVLASAAMNKVDDYVFLL